MRNKHANEPNIADILSLLSSLDEDILKAIQAKGTPIIVITATPVSHVRDLDEDDEDDYDEDEYDDDDELEDDELEDDELEDDEDGCCPEYEPSGDGTFRCAYSCPECGVCLRDYIGEEFE